MDWLLRWDLAAPFAFIYLVSLLESLGRHDRDGATFRTGDPGARHATRLRGGLLADGITSMFSAMIGSFPSTTYAQNNGVIQITGVASRHIGKWMALMLALLGLLPVGIRWVTAMPPPVLGGMALLLFGLVSVAGIRLIVRRTLNHRDGLIVAIALGVGLGAPSQTQWLGHLPAVLRGLLESSVSAAALLRSSSTLSSRAPFRRSRIRHDLPSHSESDGVSLPPWLWHFGC